MIFDSNPQKLANMRLTTENSHCKVAGITTIQKLTLCCKCGKRRTTKTGEMKPSGKFVCHSCGKSK